VFKRSRYISADGKSVDTNQELLAVGLANVGNSLFHGFPGSGAMARGALNYSSGVRTPLGGLHTGNEREFYRPACYKFATMIRTRCFNSTLIGSIGLTVMAALLFLTPYFYYIPKTSLAAVIISASFTMVDIKIVKYVYKSKSG